MKNQIETFYTCKYDRPFKEIFLHENNRDLLKGLLETALQVKIKKIVEQNIERNQGNIKVRRKNLDVLLSTEQGLIGIELNASNKDYLHPRNMAFLCDIYAHCTLIGEEYNEQLKVIQINFTYELKNSKSKQTKEIVKIYKMQTEEKETYVNNLLLYEFDMDKIMNFWYSKDKEEIEKYKYLIMMDLPKKELELLSQRDKLVDKYMSNLEKLNEDPEFREYMTKEEDQRKCYNSDIRIATEKGMKCGIEQGSIEATIRMAKVMLEEKEPIAKIIKYTNLSKEEIEKIQKIL